MCSFGTGSHVRIPGTAANQPNVFSFDTSYDEMYKTLISRDKELYPGYAVANLLHHIGVLRIQFVSVAFLGLSVVARVRVGILRSPAPLYSSCLLTLQIGYVMICFVSFLAVRSHFQMKVIGRDVACVHVRVVACGRVISARRATCPAVFGSFLYTNRSCSKQQLRILDIRCSCMDNVLVLFCSARQWSSVASHAVFHDPSAARCRVELVGGQSVPCSSTVQIQLLLSHQLASRN